MNATHPVFQKILDGICPPRRNANKCFEVNLDRFDKCIAEVDDLSDPELCAVYVGGVELIDYLTDDCKLFLFKQVLEAIDESKWEAAESENDRRRDDAMTGDA